MYWNVYVNIYYYDIYMYIYICILTHVCTISGGAVALLDAVC